MIILLLISSLNRAGERTVRSLNKRSSASKSARLLIVPRAGHQMMIDNPDGFHNAVREALEDHQE
jgi:pimeloyl-ACP methyl ester carboxylesterase